MISFRKKGLSRGFLFTISVIIFASTLVFYAQTYSTISSSSERSIISSAKPVLALMLNDDISGDTLRVLRMSVDVNDFDTGTLFASGVVDSSRNTAGDLSNYKDFVDKNFFPRVTGNEVLDFSPLLDGKAEVFFGSFAELDYNYGNSVSLFPQGDSSLQSIDINIRSSGVLDGLSWSKSPGSVPVHIYYIDDLNTFSISDTINPAGASTLSLHYPGGSSALSLGLAQVNGSSKSSALALAPLPSLRVSYSIRAAYSPAVLVPVRLNAFLSTSQPGVDSNSLLAVVR